jgi:hypothetical protein
MVGRIFGQSHPWKLRFGGGKARTEFGQYRLFRGKAKKHNRFGLRTNPPTTNGVFSQKKLQINIVQNGRFFYYFYNSSVTRNAGFTDSIYGKKF